MKKIAYTDKVYQSKLCFILLNDFVVQLVEHRTFNAGVVGFESHRNHFLLYFQHMKEELIRFINDIQQLLDNGKSLRDISKWSYIQREGGRNIPYMSITQTEKDGTVIGITANPVVKQKELKSFFDEILTGCVSLPKYTLTVYLEDKPMLQFKERIDKQNFLLL